MILRSRVNPGINGTLIAGCTWFIHRNCSGLSKLASAAVVAPGDDVTFNIAVENGGTDVARALDIVDVIRAPGVYVAGTTVVDGNPVTDDDDDRGLRAAGLVAALPRLFRGVKERMVLFAIIITVQLVLFDFSRSFLHVSPDNLSLSLDVFADRLSFYD